MFDLAQYKRLRIISVLSFLILSMSASFVCADTSEVGPDTVILSELLDEARSRNPRIRAAKAKWQAAKQQIIQAAWLDDPKASYTYAGKEVQTRVGPQEQVFGISQKLPFPTKLYYRGKAASQEAKAMREFYQATEREILTQVKQTYYELFWIRKSIEITEQDKALLENLEQVARGHFAAHAGRQQDVSKAQVEISRAIDRLLVLKQYALSLAARLNAILSRTEDEPFGELEPFELTKLSLSIKELHQLAENNREEVHAAGYRVKRDAAKVSLARWRYVPDVTTGFNYSEIGKGQTSSPNDGDNAWNVMFTVNLPIWEPTLRANLNQAKANAAASSAQYEDTLNQTRFEITDTYFRWETARNLVDLYDSAVIPQAEQSLNSAEAAYRAGEADFLNLLDSERVWLNAQITYWRAYVDTAKSLAALERAAGIELAMEGE